MDLVDDSNIKNKKQLCYPKSDHKKTEQQNEEFNFPYKPYDIQLELMRVAYDIYENSKFGLLESPTGTGKSLSLICSSLTWLKDNQKKVQQELERRKNELLDKIEKLKEEEEKSGDWLSVQTKRRDVNRELEDIIKELDVIINFQQRDHARWHAKVHGKSFEDYEALNGNNNNDTVNNKKRESGLLISSKDKNNLDLDTTKILGSSQDSNRQEQNDDEQNCGEDLAAATDDDIEKKLKKQQEELHIKPKIYYASRTHSQLSQFIGEIKKTKFAESLEGLPIKVASLASRANLCVNPDVIKLRDSSAINERCVELQRETNKEKRCPFLKSKQVNLLKEEILSSVQDIEDIVSRGKVMGSCPYYASRMSIPEAEVVVLPYNNLFHHETRKASSLILKDSIVIVDEAHNILETICSIHSSQISGQELISSHTILSRYYVKYHTRMSPKNAETIKLIVQCLTVLVKYLNDPKRHLAEYENPKSVNIDELLKTPNLNDEKKGKLQKDNNNVKTVYHKEELMIDVMKFIGASNIERFNIFKIIDYFDKSQLARKLIGFFRQDNNFDLTLDLSSIESATSLSMTQSESTTTTKKNEKNVRKLSNGTKQPPNKRRKLSMTTSDDKKVIKTGNDVCISSSDQTNLQFLVKFNQSLIKTKTNEFTTSLAYPIYKLVEFLKSLTNLANDGKVCTDYIEGNIQQSTLKFILLNPASQFKQMSQEARSIVLAGGTMQPFNEFIDLLFGPLGIDENRLKLFSCNHVISSDQLYISTLYHGSTGKPLELSYKTKSSYDYIDEIGRTILNLTNVVPGGMVCFLPSYEYEQFCFKRWSQIGVITNIEAKNKQVFREPRQTNHLKPILDEYSKTVEKGKTKGRGALLFCVVGGKMSEGINFNDDLGRCIVMVGLPYANIKSGELQQKMSYYDRTCKKIESSNNLNQLSTTLVKCNQQTNSGGCGGHYQQKQTHLTAGQQYYENLCIKGINQSIGRAIRHQNDYAAIILLDRRYSIKTSVRNGLPNWMRKNLIDNERFGPMLAQVKSFFNSITAKQITV